MRRSADGPSGASPSVRHRLPTGAWRRSNGSVRNLARRACILPFVVAVPLSGQSSEGPGPGLTGELVRFPDAVVDVSVFAPDFGVVPAALRRRIAEAEVVRFHAAGSPSVNEAIRAQVASAFGIGALREAAVPEEAGPVAIGVTSEDRLRLDWFGLKEHEGVEILAAARAMDEAFFLTIRIPDPTDSEDWWGLQAALSQAGIRRVRIVSGRSESTGHGGL